MTTNAASCLVPVSDLHAHVLAAWRVAKLPIQGAVYEGESLHCCSIETTGVAAAATPFEHHRATQTSRISACLSVLLVVCFRRAGVAIRRAL